MTGPVGGFFRIWDIWLKQNKGRNMGHLEQTTQNVEQENC